MYMYRAQSDADYPMENVNAADLLGVLWYLHNEVVWMCPRKYSVTRVRRLRVTLRNKLAPYVAFDSGRCTVPGCSGLWQKHGYAVGCQNVPYGTDMATGQPGLTGHWYSLPGPCPSQAIGHKNQSCIAAAPGGSCGSAASDQNCFYHVEDAGEVRLDELTHIKDYSAFCAAGFLEYDTASDRGINLTFWDGKTDLKKCTWRYNMFMKAFRDKYPHLPDTLGWQGC